MQTHPTASRSRQAKSTGNFDAALPPPSAGSDFFWRAVLASRHILLNQTIPHGAARLFFFLLQFSYLRKYGGDGKGSITISLRRLRTDLGANVTYICRWIEQLRAGGYLEIEKSRRGQRYILCPLGNQATSESTASPPSQASSADGNSVPSSDNTGVSTSEYASVPSSGHTPIYRNTGEHRESRELPQLKVPLPKFKPIPEGLFPSRLDKMLKDVEEQIQQVKRQFQARVFLQEKSWAWYEEQARLLERTGDPQACEKAADYRESAATLRANPSNYGMGLSAEGRAHLEAWKARREQIRARLYGRE